MQTLLLKEGFINVFSTQFLNKIKEQNKFIHLNQNELNISYNLDVFDLNGKKFEDNELILQDILYELEKKFSHLKEYFVDDNFELFYVKYKDEDQYTVTMYQLKDGKLLRSSNWINDDVSRTNLKNGLPSEKLLDELREGLNEI
jgi:hypothetical protein